MKKLILAGSIVVMLNGIFPTKTYALQESPSSYADPRVIYGYDGSNIKRVKTDSSGNIIIKDGGANYTPVSKRVNASTAQTGTAIWTPASGKRAVITDIIMTTDAAMNIYLIDGTTTFFGPLYFAANGGCVINLKTPYRSTAVDNVIKFTSSANGNHTIQLLGYEE